MYSQNERCATSNQVIPIPAGVYSASIDPSYLATFQPVVINIYFWGIRDPNGNSNNPLTTTKALEAVQYLNIEFNPYNIFFKYRGMENFNSAPNQPDYAIIDNTPPNQDPCENITNHRF